MGSSNNSLKFECPVCYNVILSRVYQCRNGHLICADCVEKCRPCPTCRVPMPTRQDDRIRNLELDKIIRGQVYCCPHAGCKEKLKVDEYTEHKKNCWYREADFCSLLGVRKSSTCDGIKLNELREHFGNDHHVSKARVHANVHQDQVTFTHVMNPNYRGVYLHMCSVTGQSSEGKKETFPIVMVETTSEDGFVYWSPMILGSPSFVARFVFYIEIGSDDLKLYLSGRRIDELDPDVPRIHFKGVVPHCPESEGEAWDRKGDPCATLNQLEKIANPSHLTIAKNFYALRVRLYDKNEQSFYQIRWANSDDEENESDSKPEMSSADGKHSTTASSKSSSTATNRRSSSAGLRRSTRLSRRPFRSPRRGAGDNASDSQSLSELSESE